MFHNSIAFLGKVANAGKVSVGIKTGDPLSRYCSSSLDSQNGKFIID
ncbi:hypothetical protein EV11_0110 [Prochlorococcus sp. SS52]|nr:hypothetical protein EV08_1967 [Prochlorococcus marinus str. SS2]KGG22992.1 hypothetical protein EV09_1735 [Prochlorococcus marinus str. SS35]KGG37551.1 hypothetical protein EV11_0110 [Prochlorococcus sp. SS52]